MKTLTEKLQLNKQTQTIQNDSLEENELLVDMLCRILGMPQISDYNHFEKFVPLDDKEFKKAYDPYIINKKKCKMISNILNMLLSRNRYKDKDLDTIINQGYITTPELNVLIDLLFDIIDSGSINKQDSERLFYIVNKIGSEAI